MNNQISQGTAILLLQPTRSKIWLAQRLTSRDFNGTWSCPGGEVDPGETPAQAASRELREETGICRPPEALKFLRITTENKSPTDCWQTHWCVVILNDGEKPQRLEDKAGEWTLFLVSDLAAGKLPLYPGTPEVLPLLLDYLKSLPPTNLAKDYECGLCTVDAAITRYRGGGYEVLLGMKKDEVLWRFPGGFFDRRQDKRKEHTVRRELGEETPGCPVHPNFTYVSSLLIEKDSRYIYDKDRIVTTLFRVQYDDSKEWEPRGGDDLPTVGWFALETQPALPPEKRSPLVRPENLIPEHHELMEDLRKFLQIPQP